MSTPLQPQKIRTIGIYGVIRPAAVDDTLIPEGAVPEVMNFHFDRKGAATLRPGLSTLGATILASRPCVGLHNAQSGTALAVFANGATSAIYSFNGSSWGMALDGGTATVSIRFVDFGSYTVAINFFYNTYSSMMFWNAGSSRHWHSSGNPINPQNMWGYAPQFGQVYKSRIYLFGDTSKEGNSSRLFFSSVISSTGIITWSPTVDYVDINPGDGEEGSGLKRFSLELLCFKPNYIYRFRTSGVDPDPLIKIGTRSQESVIEGNRGLYFHHDTGFYRYTGGYPENISRQIQDFIEAIPFSQYSSINSWNDNDHIYWSVGNVSISELNENVVLKNVVLAYTESADLWTIYSYSNEIRRGMTYTRGTTLSRLVGTDHGVVATHNSGTTDFGEIIKFRLRTKWYEWEGVTNQKIIEDLAAICEKQQAAEIMYKVNEEKNSWHSLGQVTKFVTYFLDKQIKFHRIKFQITGNSKSESLIFQGIEILKGTNEGLVKN